MTSSSPASVLGVDLSPGKPRCYRPRPKLTRWAGRPGTGTCCAPSSPSTDRVMVRGLGLHDVAETRAPSSSGWPPA